MTHHFSVGGEVDDVISGDFWVWDFLPILSPPPIFHPDKDFASLIIRTRAIFGYVYLLLATQLQFLTDHLLNWIPHYYHRPTGDPDCFATMFGFFVGANLRFHSCEECCVRC